MTTERKIVDANRQWLTRVIGVLGTRGWLLTAPHDVRRLHEIVEALDERDAALAECKRLREALSRVLVGMDHLMAESDGVAGLHLNGTVATWRELSTGGRFEEWLEPLDQARAALSGAGASDTAPAEVRVDLKPEAGR